MMKLLFIMPLLFAMGCADSTYVVPAGPPPNPQLGCVLVSDPDYGERQVCDVYYYDTGNGYAYYDMTFNIWVLPDGAYYRNNVYYRGYYPGYRAFYGSGSYHPRGFYSNHEGYRNGGEHHNGGFHSGGGRGGGFHGGGGHGGRGGGHR